MHQVVKEVDQQGDVIAMSQQAWLMLAELWGRMTDQRKQWSMPGSTQPEENVLFTKTDLQVKSAK